MFSCASTKEEVPAAKPKPKVTLFSDVVADGKIVVLSGMEQEIAVKGGYYSEFGQAADKGPGVTFLEADGEGNKFAFSRNAATQGGWITVYSCFGAATGKTAKDLTEFINGTLSFKPMGPAGATVAVSIEQGAGAYNGGVTANHTITFDGTLQEFNISVADMVCSPEAPPANNDASVTVAAGAIDMTLITSPFKVWWINTDGDYMFSDVVLSK